MKYAVALFVSILGLTWMPSATAGHLEGEVIVGGNAATGRAVLPKGFKMTLYTDRTPEARSLALGDDGTVYVGTREQGKVYAVPDSDGDGKADRVVTIADGLNLPNGVAFYRGALYVAETERIIRFDGIGAKLDRPPPPDVVYDRLPRDVWHGSRYLRTGPDGRLYLGLGAPCNVCLPKHPLQGVLARLDRDGRNFTVIAEGVRNSVGFDWLPGSGELYFTDNGRDWLGDDAPPDELNRLNRPGLHFGFPYCHAGLADPQFGAERSCREFVAPLWNFPAHVAPLGMRFYTGSRFPDEYRNQLFVAQHGSWNRKTPQGYRIALVRFENNRPVAEQTFVDGWLGRDGEAVARPVDVLPMPDGALLVSDEMSGALYRIDYER